LTSLASVNLSKIVTFMKLVGYVFARKIKTQNMTCKVVRPYNTL